MSNPLKKKYFQCLEFLNKVGLGYLSISRKSGTLSGGESQRIKLAKELSKRSTGRTMYILDEPSIGLAKSLSNINSTLKNLREKKYSYCCRA